MSEPGADHRELMVAAIEREGAAQRVLFAGDKAAATRAFAQAAALYRRSWEAAPPASYGRLVGMLKAAVLAGEGTDQAEFTSRELAGSDAHSPPAAYAHALAALILGDDASARRCSQLMRPGGEAFERTAEAIDGLAAGDAARVAAAVQAIVEDFEQRADHLTGVAVADTALMLAELAARRGIAVPLESPVLPGGGR